MNINIEQVKALVEENKQLIANEIKKIISIKSYSGDEGELVEYLISRMETYNFDEFKHDSLGSAIGKIGDGKIKIMYDAHIDTVQVTESEDWEYPPFEGKIIDGKIYGRGAVDEKPAMAGYLIAGKIIKELFKDEELPFTLYVVGSCLEEDVDGYPLTHIMETEKIVPDFVVLGEPTDLTVFRGQRGRMEIKMTTYGKSAHGAHNQKGINAVYKMSKIVNEIEKLDSKLPIKSPLGKGSITVSNIRSEAPSMCSVPDKCQIHIDRRMTVGENEETVIAELKEIAKSVDVDADVFVPVFSGKGWTGLDFTNKAYFPTWYYEEEHDIVKSGLEAASIALEKEAKSSFWSFSTNGVSVAGMRGIPTIGFAPGDESLAHSSKEFIVLEDLYKAVIFYTLFPFILSKNLVK